MSDERREVEGELHDQHNSSTDEASVTSLPIETEQGTVVIRQEATGAQVVEGGGEFPENPRPPQEPAPGAAQPERG
jgi:hypothetical protein